MGLIDRLGLTMSKAFEYDVFLSHNSADKPKARRLAEWLHRVGLIGCANDITLLLQI